MAAGAHGRRPRRRTRRGVLAIPAIRLSGLYLALATFGFGILLERLVYTTSVMFGGRALLTATRPSGLTSDKAFYFTCVAIVAAAVLLIHLLTSLAVSRQSDCVISAALERRCWGAGRR